MIYEKNSEWKNQYIKCNIFGGALFDVFTAEPLTEFHIPFDVTMHHTWRMYDQYRNLQAVYAHPASEKYETFDGALYDKQTKTLLYVPLGKTSLHIPKYARQIGYQALKSSKLERITVDPENTSFTVVDGNLYDIERKVLYFVPFSCKILEIAAFVEHIDSAVFLRPFDQIVVSPQNSVFKAVDGTLFQNNTIVWICPDVSSIHIPSDTDVWSLKVLEQAKNLREITVSEDHPHWSSLENIIYNKDCSSVIFIPRKVKEIHLPDSLIDLKNIQFGSFSNLEKISVHINTFFTARSFSGRNENCRIWVRLNHQVVVELPCVPVPALAKCIAFLRGSKAEVKLGTELFFLDCYLLKLDQSPEFCRTIQVNSWQMIKRVMEENDLCRMERILLDGRLITQKNIDKAIHLALKCGSMEIYAMLMGQIPNV